VENDKNTLKKKILNEVKNGKSYRETSRKYGVPLSTVVNWCGRKEVKSKHTRAEVKATDIEIIKKVQSGLVLTAQEISDAFSYQENAIRRRLNRLVKQKQLQFVMLSGSGKGNILFRGYIDKRLYYVKDEELDKWLHSKIPKNIPSALKRSITQKLHESGLPFEFKKTKKRVVVIDDPLFKDVQKKAKQQGISASEYVRRKLE
jgi:transposase